MTISSTVNRTSTVGDGSATAFQFPYLFFADDDLQVILMVDSTAVETIQIITTHYTVTGAGVSEGGTVNMLTAPESGETLIIIRKEHFTQTLDLVENDPFPSDLVEQQLDILTMLTQQLDTEISRSLRLADGDSASASTTLPSSAIRASKYLTFDSSGNATATDGQTASGTSVLAAGSTSTRLLSDRTADVYNVLDWGILGDGTTNNLAAFNTLMNAVNANGGGEVFLPDGTYEVTGLGVRLYDNTRVYGGKNAIVKTDDISSGSGCFYVAANTHNVTLDGFTLHGAYADGTTIVHAIYNDGFVARGGYFRQSNIAGDTVADASACTRINILNMEIRGFADAAIQLENTNDSIVTGCHIEHNGKWGVHGSGLRHSIVSDNRIHDIAPGLSGTPPNINCYGITMTRVSETPESEYPRSERCVVVGNVITDVFTWKGLDTHGGKDLIFANNFVRDSYIAMGIDSGDTNFGPENILVTGNTLLAGDDSAGHGRRNGVSLFGGDQKGTGNAIMNNMIDGFGASSNRGAIAISNQLGYKVDGNLILNSSRSGIGLNTAGKASGEITNNYIRDVAASGGVQYGILIEDGNVFAFIDGNTIQSTPGKTGMIGMGGTLFTLPNIASAIGRAAAVVNAGGGVCTLPFTNPSATVTTNPFAVGDTVTIAGTTNYNGVFDILAIGGTDPNFTINITASFVSETLSSGDTFVVREGVHLGRNNFINLTTDMPVTTTLLSSTITVDTASVIVQGVAAATITATGLIPAGAQVLGVETYNTVTLTGSGLSGFSVGDGSDANIWGEAPLNAGGSTDQTDFTADPRGTWSASARNVVLTGTGANFTTTGAVRITAYYIDYK